MSNEVCSSAILLSDLFIAVDIIISLLLLRRGLPARHKSVILPARHKCSWLVLLGHKASCAHQGDKTLQKSKKNAEAGNLKLKQTDGDTQQIKPRQWEETLCHSDVRDVYCFI